MNPKEYYEKNKEVIKKRNLEYYYKNKERVLKYQKDRLKKFEKDKSSKYYIRHNLTPRIKKGSKCAICGSISNLQRHHWNYNKPKLFSILCKECHSIQHIKNPQINKYYGNS